MDRTNIKPALKVTDLYRDNYDEVFKRSCAKCAHCDHTIPSYLICSLEHIACLNLDKATRCGHYREV